MKVRDCSIVLWYLRGVLFIEYTWLSVAGPQGIGFRPYCQEAPLVPGMTVTNGRAGVTM